MNQSSLPPFINLKTATKSNLTPLVPRSHLKPKGAATAAASCRVVIGNAWWIRVEAETIGGKLNIKGSKVRCIDRGKKLWAVKTVSSNRRMRKTACPLVWEG
jgi:hypothetical protein